MYVQSTNPYCFYRLDPIYRSLAQFAKFIKQNQVNSLINLRYVSFQPQRFHGNYLFCSRLQKQNIKFKVQTLNRLFTQMEALQLAALMVPTKMNYDQDELSINSCLESFQMVGLDDGRISVDESVSQSIKVEESKQQRRNKGSRNCRKHEITEWDSMLLECHTNGKLITLNKMIIEHTRFPHLIHLNLSSNYIVSVELLSYMVAPHLRTLTLSDNMISCARSLRRCCLDRLQELMLDVNEITDLFTLAQANMRNLALIRVDRCYWKSNGDELSFLAKFQTSKLRHCTLQSRFRIGRLNFAKTIAKKYEKTKLKL